MSDPSLETIDLLLDSMSSMVGEDGMEHQFNASGKQWQLHGLYVTVFFSRRKLVAAALHARSAGAAYLRDLSISDIMDMLSDFAKRHYPLWSVGVPFAAQAASYLPTCDAATRMRLAEALRASPVFTAPEVMVIFPLVTIRVEADFSAAAVFLRPPAGLALEFDPSPRELAPELFPPLVDARMGSERPASWLGLRAANRASAAKRARAVLGAVALTPSMAYRQDDGHVRPTSGFEQINARNGDGMGLDHHHLFRTLRCYFRQNLVGERRATAHQLTGHQMVEVV